jgi:hypothetical protein
MLKIFSISKKFIISVKLAQVTRALSEYCVAREASSSPLLRKGNTAMICILNFIAKGCRNWKVKNMVKLLNNVKYIQQV